MAELSSAETTAADPCCAPEQQVSCCEPSAKADCCGHGEGCGCAAGSEPKQPAAVREQVRERYAAAAVQVTTTNPGAGCCAPSETFDGGSLKPGPSQSPKRSMPRTSSSHPAPPRCSL
jgi:hypothetical protein